MYLAIDLKSFYASVECVARKLDPLDANLVVADLSRTEKTICLAVSPSLKSHGISGRARLFEVVQRVKEVNALRRSKLHGRDFSGKSTSHAELQRCPDKALDYIVAPPRMAEYMRVSTQIYGIYLRYIAPEDIHVYSVDEVFIDASRYLRTYHMTVRELACTLIRAVLSETGITATAGIGTNLYLCKIAMDIVAKRMPPDEHGARVAELDEQRYRELLWDHRPITDFWRIGGGYSRTLARYGMFTMGDVARMSLINEALLYRLFGVNAELLIDHAWGWEPCTLRDIKAYRPRVKSLSSGQVLSEPYDFGKARLILQEMADSLTLDLVRKGLLTDQVVLTVCYDIENLSDPARRARYRGETKPDGYGRQVPKRAHGSENLGCFCSSTRKITEAALRLINRIADPELLVRRLYIVANHTVSERSLDPSQRSEQLSLFDALEPPRESDAARRERDIQKTILKLRARYGKNVVLRGMNFKEGATAVERNRQIGGHRM